ncbi:hypothetical protein Gotur_027443, partial [Gossypium turneri]
GFHITFVNSEFNHRRLVRSRGKEVVKGLPDFWFEAIPDGLPPFDSDATQCAAQLIGVPYVQLWMSLAVSFLGYLQYKELAQRGIVPFKDEHFVSDGTLEMPIDWIPGMPNMRIKDIPSFIRTTDPDDIMLNFVMEVSQECLNLSSIIFNTFNEFDKRSATSSCIQIL